MIKIKYITSQLLNIVPYHCGDYCVISTHCKIRFLTHRQAQVLPEETKTLIWFLALFQSSRGHGEGRMKNCLYLQPQVSFAQAESQLQGVFSFQKARTQIAQ